MHIAIMNFSNMPGCVLHPASKIQILPKNINNL
nr:MAG TPA: hypothetical protein [Caudoviricetes sp.]